MPPRPHKCRPTCCCRTLCPSTASHAERFAVLHGPVRSTKLRRLYRHVGSLAARRNRPHPSPSDRAIRASFDPERTRGHRAIARSPHSSPRGPLWPNAAQTGLLRCPFVAGMHGARIRRPAADPSKWSATHRALWRELTQEGNENKSDASSVRYKCVFPTDTELQNDREGRKENFIPPAVRDMTLFCASN